MIHLHLQLSSYLPGLLCIFNWSVHNVMNLYKAISQNEYLSAFPVLRYASHLSHISIISKYNADIQSPDSKTVGTPRHTKSHRIWIQNNALRPLWCMDVHNYTTQHLSLRGAPLSGNDPFFWHSCFAFVSCPLHIVQEMGQSVYLMQCWWYCIFSYCHQISRKGYSTVLWRDVF